MTRYGVVMAVAIAVGCVVALASGQWLDAVALFGASVLVAREDRELRRADAKKDLREIYPPKRDQFQRDLERLSKLRGNVVTKTGYAPPEDSYVQMPEAVLAIVLFGAVIGLIVSLL
jgi:hypothetical protein